jgi:hypothetical protein
MRIPAVLLLKDPAQRPVLEKKLAAKARQIHGRRSVPAEDIGSKIEEPKIYVSRVPVDSDLDRHGSCCPERLISLHLDIGKTGSRETRPV